jgi:hypothetical protein
VGADVRGEGGEVVSRRPRHIPDASHPGFTFCGRHLSSGLLVIDIRTDCIEDAECQSCQQSDDRRTREEYRKTEEYRNGVES